MINEKRQTNLSEDDDETWIKTLKILSRHCINSVWVCVTIYNSNTVNCNDAA